RVCIINGPLKGCSARAEWLAGFNDISASKKARELEMSHDFTRRDFWPAAVSNLQRIEALGFENGGGRGARQEGYERGGRRKILGCGENPGREDRRFLQGGRQGSDEVDALDLHQLADLLHCNLDLAAGGEFAGEAVANRGFGPNGIGNPEA